MSEREMQGAADRIRRRRLARAVSAAVEALEFGGRGDVARELTEALYQREHPSPIEPEPACTGKRPAAAGITGIGCDDHGCPRHGLDSIRLLNERQRAEHAARSSPTG